MVNKQTKKPDPITNNIKKQHKENIFAKYMTKDFLHFQRDLTKKKKGSTTQRIGQKMSRFLKTRNS
jgi:hypothetical protein